MRLFYAMKMKRFAALGVFALLLSVQTLSAQTDTVQQKEKRERFWKLSDYLQIHGYVDTQFDYLLQRENNGVLTQQSVIMLRRARFHFAGQLHPMIDFRIQADLAISPRLLDAWVRVKFCKYVNLEVGQLKTPLTMATVMSPLDLEFIELPQSMATLAGYSDITGIPNYSDGLEVGAMLTGTLVDFEKNGERIPILNYYAGIFGGSGVNLKKDNLSKDFSARIDFFPFVKGFRLSGSVYYGNYPLFKDRNAPRIRYSGGAEYKDQHWIFRTEYLQGVTGIADDNPTALDSVYLVNTQGLYALVGYWFDMGWGSKSTMVQRLRPAIRYDYYLRDRQDPSTTAHYFSFDLDWWPEEHVRVQLDYTLRFRKTYANPGHTFAAKVSVRF